MQEITQKVTELTIVPQRVSTLNTTPVFDLDQYPELQFNNHGSADWYKEELGSLFPDEFYPIMAAYTSGICPKEWKSMVKRSKKRPKDEKKMNFY
jgi:hypothetical protein